LLNGKETGEAISTGNRDAANSIADAPGIGANSLRETERDEKF